MFGHILVAIDFSDASIRALRWTAKTFPHAELTQFHAMREVKASSDVRHSLSGKVSPREAKLDAQANIEELAQHICPAAQVVVREGPPVEEIRAVAESSGANLVVLAAHEKRIWPWDRYDELAEKTCDCVDLPILIYRPTKVTGEMTVLAPLDLREGSEPVGEMAGRIAVHLGARLIVLHVLPKTFQGFLRAASSTYQTESTLRKAESSAREEALSRIPQECREEIGVQVRVARGQPVRQILDTVESEGVDLVVMGKTHVRKRTERALMGHVTGKALRSAPCAVLTVPI
ncbi:MAG: universal stress protein [Gemmatimonadota bacterium]|nr:MAG: universal stress protein [Gemmatimonadota bacterium]